MRALIEEQMKSTTPAMVDALQSILNRDNANSKYSFDLNVATKPPVSFMFLLIQWNEKEFGKPTKLEPKDVPLLWGEALKMEIIEKELKKQQDFADHYKAMIDSNHRVIKDMLTRAANPELARAEQC